MRDPEQHTLSFPTDSAVPQTIIPIFYLHEGDHPFCRNPHCICHANESGLRAFLQGVINGTMKLRKAYNGVLVGGEIK